jgi:hypothetical protein
MADLVEMTLYFGQFQKSEKNGYGLLQKFKNS